MINISEVLETNRMILEEIKTGFELLWESEGKIVTHRAWRKR